MNEKVELNSFGSQDMQIGGWPGEGKASIVPLALSYNLNRLTNPANSVASASFRPEHSIMRKNTLYSYCLFYLFLADSLF